MYVSQDVMLKALYLCNIVLKLYYILKSKYTWFCWKENLNSYHKYTKNFNKNIRKIRREFLKFLPYFLVHSEVERLNNKIRGF